MTTITYSQYYRATRRVQRGVTLLEVIFAIGVILIGLLGLLSVLPLAGNQSQDAIGLNTATVLGDAAFDALTVAGLLSNDRLYYRYTGDDVEPGDSVCIDPLSVALSPTAIPTYSNGYSADHFPPYRTDHNALVDPSLPNTGPPAADTGLRLRRVGLKTRNGVPFSTEQALRLVENQDDLPVERPKDRTLNPRLRGAVTRAGGLSYGRHLPTGEFSWFATLNPHSIRDNERFAMLSVVVVQNRDRGFVYPTGPVDNAEQNVTDTRVALVTDRSGFNGGAGGVVTLQANKATISRITPNHWVMLSRVDAAPRGPVHRWYRVAGTEGDAVVDTSTNTWRRRVRLDGSDWDFSNPTHATIVAGVVSVTERVISLKDFR